MKLYHSSLPGICRSRYREHERAWNVIATSIDHVAKSQASTFNHSLISSESKTNASPIDKAGKSGTAERNRCDGKGTYGNVQPLVERSSAAVANGTDPYSKHSNRVARSVGPTLTVQFNDMAFALAAMIEAGEFDGASYDAVGSLMQLACTLSVSALDVSELEYAA